MTATQYTSCRRFLIWTRQDHKCGVPAVSKFTDDNGEVALTTWSICPEPLEETIAWQPILILAHEVLSTILFIFHNNGGGSLSFSPWRLRFFARPRGGTRLKKSQVWAKSSPRKMVQINPFRSRKNSKRLKFQEAMTSPKNIEASAWLDKKL